MAEACRIVTPHPETKVKSACDDNCSVFNVFCVFISFITVLADLTTDLLVCAEYCNNRQWYWAAATFVFILEPNILINIFSLRWIAMDKKIKIRHWLTHCFLVGFYERFIVFLKKIFSCKSIELMKTHKLLSQQNDLSLLHFLYAFSGTIPQIILQTYSVIILNENYYTKAFSLTASIASVVWACGSYVYSIVAIDCDQFKWRSIFLKLVWHLGMLIARIAGIILFTLVFGIWTLLPLGLHWAAMTIWIVTQKTTFCPNQFEETFYNAVMGFVYCFCYINLREGHTRYRLMLYYTLMVSQNFGSLFLYVLLSDFERQKKSWSIVATLSIVFGTLVGICGMIFYYRWFHAKGPILWKQSNHDIELNNKLSGNKIKPALTHVRSFKSQREITEKPRNDILAANEPAQVESEVADKKVLIDHLVAETGSPTIVTAILEHSFSDSSVEFHTVENTPLSMNIPTAYEEGNKNVKSKKKIVCFPSELALKLATINDIESSIDEISTSTLNIHKRRGICSSDELKDNLDLLNQNRNKVDLQKSYHCLSDSQKKSSSDSIDMDLDLSLSDINSSDINTYNENIVQKLCLSALKNIKGGNQDADIENIQKIALDILKEMYSKKDKLRSLSTSEILNSKHHDLDTPSESLSVHDYENICAVNIAREVWGLRSWNGYIDIENWLHDGSVVRDRRRDTLTSASSEISSCISQDLKNSIFAASVPSIPRKPPTYSNIFVKYEQSNLGDYANMSACHSGNEDTFLAKPCVVDTKDCSYLEPILEELDDIPDIDTPIKKRLNSESSLVATIDEIRKATVPNSPRNLYHRREHVWDSPQFNSSTKLESSLKRALWKEPSKFDSSNIMKFHPEKEDSYSSSQSSKLGIKEFSFSSSSPNSQDDKSSPTKKYKSTNLTKRTKKVNNNLDNIQDLSNKDIDFLWKLVSENSMSPSSVEDLSSTQATSSLQSLIVKDINPKNSQNIRAVSVKKSARSKPRRKFSILRERFEPKLSKRSSQESHSSNECLNYDSTETLIINVKNRFSSDMTKHIETENFKAGSDSLPKQSNLCVSSVGPQASRASTSFDVKEKRKIFMKQVLGTAKVSTDL